MALIFSRFCSAVNEVSEHTEAIWDLASCSRFLRCSMASLEMPACCQQGVCLPAGAPVVVPVALPLDPDVDGEEGCEDLLPGVFCAPMTTLSIKLQRIVRQALLPNLRMNSLRGK